MPMGLAGSAGDVTTARNVMLEVHYDNPANVAIRDQSGFKLFYTEQLRANDAVIMTLGHLNINIPAGATSHEHVNDCAGACTKKLKQPVTALWAGLHMHSAGKAIWTQHFRGDTELAPLGYKRSWDFNQQSPSHVKAIIEPGDRLVTHCIYSSSRDTPTTFGEVLCPCVCRVTPSMAARLPLCVRLGLHQGRSDDDCRLTRAAHTTGHQRRNVLQFPARVPGRRRAHVHGHRQDFARGGFG